MTEAQKQRKKQSKDMTRRKKLMHGHMTALVGNDPAARAISFSSTGRSTAWSFSYHGLAHALPDNTKHDLQALTKLLFSSYSKERLSGAMQLKQALKGVVHEELEARSLIAFLHARGIMAAAMVPLAEAAIAKRDKH